MNSPERGKKKNKIARLYDSIALEYDYYMSKTGHHQAQERILQKLYKKIKGRVLDVATGTGFIALKIKASCPETEVTGIDISKKMIAEAKRNAKERRLRIKFLIANAEKLNFLDQSFNLAICSLGFLWFQNKSRVLKELKRVVKKGGRLIIIEEEGETVRSGKSLKKFSKNLQKFFTKIEKLELPISLEKIKARLEDLSFRFEKKYKAAIDKNHCFVGMVFGI